MTPGGTGNRLGPKLWVVGQQGQERLPFWRLTHLALAQLQVQVEGQPSPGTGSPAIPCPQGTLSPIHSSHPQMCPSCKKRQRWGGGGDGGWPEKPEPELPEFRPQWEWSREGRRCQERAGETVRDDRAGMGRDCPHLLLTVTTCSLRGHLSGPLAQLLVSPGAGLR